MISLLILDFDDTIADNRLLDFKAFEIPCKTIGIAPPSQKSIAISRKRGLLAREIMQKHLEKLKKLYLLGDFLSRRDEFLSDPKSTRHLCLKKHAIQVLALLRRKKVKCILCTARKNKQIVKLFLRDSGISRYFSSTYFMHDMGFSVDNLVRSNRILIKASLLHQIIRDERINPQQMLYVGNSSEDYEAAARLRIPFVYLENHYLSKEPGLDSNRVGSMHALKQKIHSLVPK